MRPGLARSVVVKAAILNVPASLDMWVATPPARFLSRALRRSGSVESPRIVRRAHDGSPARSHMSSQSFGELGASRAVVKTLADRGITAPFPVQQLVVPDVMAGRDVLVKSPTGSGKTLAFAVPLVEMIKPDDPRPSVLVLAPTRELAIQIGDGHAPARQGAGRCPSRPSTAAPASSRRSRRRAAPTSLVATPGRLEDLLERRAVSAGRRARTRARRGRPHARHGLPARRRPHRRPRCRASARHCSSRPLSTERSAVSPASTRPTRAVTSTLIPPSGAARSSTASSGSGTRRSSMRWCASCATTSGA